MEYLKPLNSGTVYDINSGSTYEFDSFGLKARIRPAGGSLLIAGDDRTPSEDSYEVGDGEIFEFVGRINYRAKSDAVSLKFILFDLA